MFEQFPRPLKVALVVLFIAALAVLVLVILGQRGLLGKKAVTTQSPATTGQSQAAVTPDQTGSTPPPGPNGETPSAASVAQPPVIQVQRDPGAPPMVSSEDALKQRGGQSAPTSGIAPPTPPPTLSAPSTTSPPTPPPTLP